MLCCCMILDIFDASEEAMISIHMRMTALIAQDRGTWKERITIRDTYFPVKLSVRNVDKNSEGKSSTKIKIMRKSYGLVEDIWKIRNYAAQRQLEKMSYNRHFYGCGISYIRTGGALLEPLWKELTSLADSRQDSEEMIQLDNEIKNLKEQSRILNR